MEPLNSKENNIMAERNERLRPQFHFTAEKGWLNDPNGLVYYEGEYHLFFQHNPYSTDWGNMTWGHAVSPDLVNWRQLPNAIEPDEMGTIFSGSAVVDWENRSNLQEGKEKTLLAFYTAAGRCLNPKRKDTQCMAFSNDRGRTWHKFEGNPVVPNMTDANRDPKVIWHDESKSWIMALYVDKVSSSKSTIHTVRFLTSTDLKTWTVSSDIDGFYECPDIFELPVRGGNSDKRWVLFGADGRYVIGQFDGKSFIAESGKHSIDWGTNYYAAQTYSDIPASDGRRIIISWMAGGNYPEMPFNQQMTFPCELTLWNSPSGIRMRKYPVSEISLLRKKTVELSGVPVRPGDNPLSDITGELFDIEAEIETGDAIELCFKIRNHTISYVPCDQEIFCLGLGFNRGNSARLAAVDGRIRLRILVDRSSVELFGNDGEVSFSSCIVPNPENKSLGFHVSGGEARIVSMRIHELRPSSV